MLISTFSRPPRNTIFMVTNIEFWLTYNQMYLYKFKSTTRGSALRVQSVGKHKRYSYNQITYPLSYYSLHNLPRYDQICMRTNQLLSPQHHARFNIIIKHATRNLVWDCNVDRILEQQPYPAVIVISWVYVCRSLYSFTFIQTISS